MKSPHYTAVTASVYRKAVDDYVTGGVTDRVNEILIKELDKISHREYTTGFYFDDGKLKQNYKTSEYMAGSKYMGYVTRLKNNEFIIMSKNTLRLNDEVEILNSKCESFSAAIRKIKDLKGTEVVYTKGEGEYTISLETGGKISVYSILRK
jgi:putative protease